MMCQCSFVDCNKHTTLVGNVDNEESCAPCGGQGAYAQSLYLPLNFAVNLKLLSTMCLIKKKNKKVVSRLLCIRQG